MKKRFSNVNSIASGFMRLAGLVLFGFLLIVVISRTGTAQPNQNIATTPVSTVEATIWLATVTPNPQVTSTIGPGTVTPNPSPQVTGTVISEVVMERDYGVWSFRAVSRPGMESWALVEFDYDSVSSLINYALANQALGTQLAAQGGQVDVGITFNTFVTPEQFRAWAPTKGLTIKETVLRTVDSNGQEGTISVPSAPAPFNDKGLLPQDDLDEIMHTPGWPTITIRGVYWTRATVDATRLPELALDPLVFLADVTPNIVRNELIAAGWTGVEHDNIRVDRNTPFWRMEELGLENFTP
jgi:hypothetical protein